MYCFEFSHEPRYEMTDIYLTLPYLSPLIQARVSLFDTEKQNINSHECHINSGSFVWCVGPLKGPVVG